MVPLGCRAEAALDCGLGVVLVTVDGAVGLVQAASFSSKTGECDFLRSPGRRLRLARRHGLCGERWARVCAT